MTWSSYPLKQGTGLDAVRLVEEQGYSVPEAAQRLGIPKPNLTNWRRQYREGRLAPGHKRAQPTEQEAEVRRLRAEIKRLEVENEILKKASAKSLQQEVSSSNQCYGYL